MQYQLNASQLIPLLQLYKLHFCLYKKPSSNIALLKNDESAQRKSHVSQFLELVVKGKVSVLYWCSFSAKHL